MTAAYINHIATAVPPNDVHAKFTEFAFGCLNERKATLFKRMAERSQIDHRYSFFGAKTNTAELDSTGFYKLGQFPDTAARMRFYQAHAFELAQNALDQLNLAKRRDKISHVIITSCTGFYAPGLDLEIIEHYGLNPEIERTMIGFMGCYAALNALKLARHIVRSVPAAQVLVVNLELCTLHLHETDEIEELLSFLIFADGCAASIISAEPGGLVLNSFSATVMPDSQALITWAIGDAGFDMVLSGKVPGAIYDTLPKLQTAILGSQAPKDIRHWAVHPGGRTILDAVQKSFILPDTAMRHSRRVLQAYGNMSSATVMFVLKDILELPDDPGAGCAMAFGPGVTLESMLFHKTGF